MVVCFASGVASAQAPEQTHNLKQYEGRYDYRDGLSLFMVASDEQLVAIIDQSKYLLRPSGVDSFLNPPGDLIPFVRNSAGRIVAFKEYGEQFLRRSSSVPASVRLLLKPRADGPGGERPHFRYTVPPTLTDGIQVGRASPPML